MKRFEHGGNVYAYDGCVDFSANVNPLGMPQVAQDVLRNNIDAFARYPDPACIELTGALAAFEEVPRSWVLACAGASDAFARVCSVVRPRRALVCAPCYSGYEQALEQVSAEVVVHELAYEKGFALEGLTLPETGINLVFVANPNNPTGRCVRRDVLTSLLDEALEREAIVVLDECFIDLTACTRSNELLDTYHNLVIVKAFTKTFALAGLRLGYVLCSNAQILERLRAAGQPWAVSVPAQLAGVACVADEQYIARSLDFIARERERMRQALVDFGLQVVPSDANFLLFRVVRETCFEGSRFSSAMGLVPEECPDHNRGTVPLLRLEGTTTRELSPGCGRGITCGQPFEVGCDGEPHGLYEQLLCRGILVRPCENYYGLNKSWNRVAVRLPHENELLLKALGEVLA